MDEPDTPWAFAERELGTLSAMSRRAAKGTQCSAGELLSEAISRVPRLFETHDPAKGDLRRYVLGSCKRYMKKWVRRTRKIVGREDSEPLYDRSKPEVSHEHDAANREAALRLLSRLNEDQRYVVVANMMGDSTLQDVAHDLGIAKGSVAKVKKRAIALMRGEWYTHLCRSLGDLIDSEGV